MKKRRRSSHSPWVKKRRTTDVEYEVEAIISKRNSPSRKGTPEYEVKWTGYTMTTWEPAENIPVELRNEYDARWTHAGGAWTSDRMAALDIQTPQDGSVNSIEPKTIMDMYRQIARKVNSGPALCIERGKTRDWEIINWRLFYGMIKKCALSLIDKGVGRWDGICVMGPNSPEYLMAYLGGIFCGGISSGIYVSNGPDACRHVINKMDAVIVFTGNAQLTLAIHDIAPSLPKLTRIVQLALPSPKYPIGGYVLNVSDWEKFLVNSSDFLVLRDILNERIASQRPSHCCSLIWTSGTTGPPKGVMLSHDNIVWEAKVIQREIPFMSHHDRLMVDIFLPMLIGNSTWFARPVPRVWEKMEEKMREIGAQTTGMKKSIAMWAKDIGHEASKNLREGKDVPWGFWLADKMVLSKVREALGLSNARLFISAAAPISVDTLEFFNNFNIPIVEIYGMSETTGDSTWQLTGRHKLGSVGKALTGTEMKIDPHTDEILFRGRHRFLGYLDNPEETSKAIDDEGWLHSGDAGTVDEEGYLKITGRIKEIIITAGGENIPPVVIENEIKKSLPGLISNAVVVGDKRKYLTCIVTLKVKPKSGSIPGEYPLSDELAESAIDFLKQHEIYSLRASNAYCDPAVYRVVQMGIEKANSQAYSNAQRVQKVWISPVDFTLEQGELTETMKLKRRVVLANYAEQINDMYCEE